MATLTTKQKSDLPDSKFLYIDSEGGRHFPVPDAAHIRDAISRIPQSNAPGLTDEKKGELQDKARAMLDRLEGKSSKATDDDSADEEYHAPEDCPVKGDDYEGDMDAPTCDECDPAEMNSEKKADEPDSADVLQPTEDSKPRKKKGLTAHFISKLKELLKSKINPSDFDEAVKTARSHAGGKAKAERARAEKMDEMDADSDSDSSSPDEQMRERARMAERVDDADDDDEPTGVMVGCYLSPLSASQIAQPGGERAEDLHVTLCYLGQADALNQLALGKLMVAVEEIARYSSPLVGMVSGVGRFDADDDDSGDVLYASVDMPGLNDLRERLAQRLSYSGLQPNAEHGFTPHITLAYIAEDAPTPDLELGGIPLRFDALTVIVRGERTQFQLQGGSAGYFQEKNLAEICSKGKSERLFIEYSNFAEPPEWIPYLPKPGEYKHPRYGEINITRARNEHFVQNFKDGVYQDKLPLDAEHETKLSGAVGWITDMRTNEDGSADARVDWTDRGTALIEADRFKYVSPEWYDEWQDPATEQTYKDVAIGGALTTRPFFKEDSLRPLIANERGLYALDEAQTDKTAQSYVFMALAPTHPKNQAAPPEKPHTQRGVTKMADNKDGAGQALAGEAKTLTELQSEIAILKQASEAQADTIKQLSERNAALEKDARTKRFQEVSREWIGDQAKHIALMEKLGEGSEDFKSYVEQQNAIVEQLKQSKLFEEIGRPGSTDANANSAEARVEAAARALTEKDASLTHAQAVTRVLSEDKQLASDYSNERRTRR